MRYLTALLLLVRAAVPTAFAQDAQNCDEFTQQIDSTNQDLDQLQTDALPWLVEAGQFGAVAPSDLILAAAHGLSGLTPALAASYGGIASQLGATIDGWRSANDGSPSDSYWRDLTRALQTWDPLFSTMAPVAGEVPSLSGMSTALSQLDQLSARAQGDLALRDAFDQQLQDCQAQMQPPNPDTPPAAGPNDQQALCSVGGQSGYSNSDCFQLENDAAFAIWQACTEAYFAAERQAFQSGGDPPVNTCDGAWNTTLEELQRKWVSGP